MPLNKSYHVFLLEDGEKLSLVTQVFVNAKPSLTVASDTLIYLSNKVTRVSSPDCQPISAAQLQQCILERVKEKIPSMNISCLPFQVKSLFPTLHDLYPQCENETEGVKYYKIVGCSSNYDIDSAVVQIENSVSE